jgi:hypothetical protein
MQQGSEVSGTASGPAVDLIVKGWMEMDGNTGVGYTPNGKAATHPNTVQLALGCGGPFNQNSTYTPTIVNGVQKCQSPSYQIAPAGILPTTTVPAPTADFLSWWTYADPGPNFPCQSPTGSPPMWDNNTSFDLTSTTQGSITIANQPATNGIVDLTPSTADYDCKGSDGVSEIKWTRSTKTLYVNGTFYIDGSGTISATPVQYTGDGTVYVSGTFLIKNAIVCAYLVSAKTGCDTSAWLTTANPPILMIAANGYSLGGSTATCPCNQTATNDSVEIKSSWFQGGLYGTRQIEIDTSSNMQGPMVSGTEIISQSAGAPFPHFPTVPTGTPGNGISSYIVEAPKYYSGG